jgi:hypothetical protein
MTFTKRVAFTIAADRRRRRTLLACAVALVLGGVATADVAPRQRGDAAFVAAHAACLDGEDRPYMPGVDDTATTPYATPASTDAFVQGATLDLSGREQGAAELPALLTRMRDEHHINTISVYGLEALTADDGRRDLLFAQLTRLNMKIVIRLEGYHPDTFAFRAADADRVIDEYRSLLDYVSAPARRDRVAYLALNMPVDDRRVQERLGGINSPLSARRQVEYGTALVSRVRATLGRLGADGAKVFLSLFYGWDGSYRIPSYAATGADGYFLTNYSYPGGRVADQNSDEDELINKARLRTAIDRATRAHPGSPIVVEYGFQTLQYQRGVMPGQTAGLVTDVTAKRKALRATTRFYCDGYPNVIGTVYFGYNLYKAEGSPTKVLDFALT